MIMKPIYQRAPHGKQTPIILYYEATKASYTSSEEADKMLS